MEFEFEYEGGRLILQGDQINMVVFIWYLVTSDLSSERYCTHVPWKSTQGTRKTWPCLIGHPVVSDLEVR